MAQQNFRVKRGLEVGLGATVLSATFDGKVGIKQANPTADLDVNGKAELDELNVSGLSTFVGDPTVSGTLRATNVDITGIGSFPTLDTTNGTINYLTNINADVSGIGSITTLQATTAAIGTIDVTTLTANSLSGDLTGGVIGNLTGNADTATTLQTSRDFSVSGDVATASAVSFNGSSNVDLAVTLSNNFTASTSGTITASGFFTGAEGSAIRVTTDTISGPATLNIDPAGVGDNTGTVVIKGDLQVDGTQTVVNSTAVSIEDKNILLGDGTANDAAADGGGITLESSQGNKTFNWVDLTDSWTSSENLDLKTGKTYKIVGVDVLSADTLGSGVVNSNLTNVGTLTGVKVTGITTSAEFQGDLTGNVTGNITGNVTGIADEAVTLQTSRNFEITGDVTATAVGFDGSANVTLATSLSSTFSANTTGTIQAASFIKTSGTSSQFLKADGSSDSTAYIDLADLSVATTATGTAALVYNNLTGVFTYTPPDLSSYLTSYTETQTLNDVLTLGNTSSQSLTAGGNGSASGVTLSDGKIDIRTGSGSVAAIDLYCEVSNAHYTRIQAAPHASYSGNAIVTLPTSTGTLLLTDGDGSSLTNIVTQITAGDGISVSGSTGNVTLSTTVAGIEVGSTFPSTATATEGDTFYNTNYGKVFIFYDGFWVDTSPASGSGSGSSNLISSSTTNGTNAVTSTTTTSGSNPTTAAAIQFTTDNGTTSAPRWVFMPSGGFLPTANDSYDIGSAEYKVRDIYEADSSDARLKTDVVDYTGGLEFVESLRVVDFTWKEGVDGKPAGNRETGLIAQEVKEALDASNYNSWRLHTDGDRQGVDKKQLIPALISAVQELTEEVRTLRSRVQELENN